MALNADGNTTRPGLRNPGELNYQIGSQSDQNEYVSQVHEEYGGMPSSINPPHFFGPLQQFTSGSRHSNPKLQYQALTWLTQEFLRLKQPSWLLR